jgi:hypothetical protein
VLVVCCIWFRSSEVAAQLRSTLVEAMLRS